LNLYELLKQKGRVVGVPRGFFDSPYANDDLEIFEKIITSREMETAWKAITKRSEIAPHQDFATAVLRYPGELRWLENTIKSKGIKSRKRDAAEFNKLASTFCEFDNNLLTGRLLQVCRDIDREIEYLRENSEDVRVYLLKNAAVSAKRTFLIQRMAEDLLNAYGTPLYAVVANTSALILGEQPLSANHVGKIVRAYRQRLGR